jgi:hypothetical protein
LIGSQTGAESGVVHAGTQPKAACGARRAGVDAAYAACGAGGAASELSERGVGLL